MVNKEKLLLLATIYTLLPGAMTDAAANAAECGKAKTKKTSQLKQDVVAKHTIFKTQSKKTT